jgi:hypothetical protein
LFDKKKGKLFFTVFFLAREQKNSGKKFFLFIEHEVLFYETPFLHSETRIYFCGQSEEGSISGGMSPEFVDERRNR